MKTWMVAVIGLVMLLVAPLAGCSSEPTIEGKKVADWLVHLRHGNWKTQSRAREVLASHPDLAIPHLSRALFMEDPAIRRGAAQTLGEMGEKAAAAVPSLLSRLDREEDDVVRLEIMKSLVGIDRKAPGVREELERRAEGDRSQPVRAEAKRGLLLLTAPPETKKPSGPTLPAPEEQKLLLREAVTSAMTEQGIAFGLVAEVARENRRAAVVWPAMRAGEILDDDIVALVFERGAEGTWLLLPDRISLSQGSGGEKLAQALGGVDGQRVIRPCGVPREDLARILGGHPRAFAEAVKAKDAANAVALYEEFTKAFSFPLAAYDDMLPEILISHVKDPGASLAVTVPESGNTLSLVATRKEGTENLQASLSACDDGFAISSIE